jgi:hypothetical protein
MKIIYCQFIIYIFPIYSFLFQLGKKRKGKKSISKVEVEKCSTWTLKFRVQLIKNLNLGE